MIVYQIETRDKDYKSIIITASYERTRKELDTAEERNVDVIVTPYTLEDFDEEEVKWRGYIYLLAEQDTRIMI